MMEIRHEYILLGLACAFLITVLLYLGVSGLFSSIVIRQGYILVLENNFLAPLWYSSSMLIFEKELPNFIYKASNNLLMGIELKRQKSQIMKNRNMIIVLQY